MVGIRKKIVTIHDILQEKNHKLRQKPPRKGWELDKKRYGKQLASSDPSVPSFQIISAENKKWKVSKSKVYDYVKLCASHCMNGDRQEKQDFSCCWGSLTKFLG